jgi:hypothetical protein
VLALGGVAAAIAVVVALAVGSGDRNSDNDVASSARELGDSGGRAAENAPLDSNVKSPAQLRAFVDGVLQRQRDGYEDSSDNAGDAAGAPSASTTAPAPVPDAPGTASANTDKQAYRSASGADCVAELQTTLRQSSGPVARAEITYQGEPAELVVFRSDRGTVAVVYERDSCRLIVSQLSR